MMVLVSTPPGATAGRTLESIKQVEDYILEQEQDAVNGMFALWALALRVRRKTRVWLS